MKEKSKKDGQNTAEKVASEIFGMEVVSSDPDNEDLPTLPNDGIIDDHDFKDDESKKALSGSLNSSEKAKKITSSTPVDSGDDIDADWSDSTGQEMSLGDDPTPDQDQVSSIGQAWGTDYRNDEQLDISKKIREKEQTEDKDDENSMHEGS